MHAAFGSRVIGIDGSMDCAVSRCSDGGAAAIYSEGDPVDVAGLVARVAS